MKARTETRRFSPETPAAGPGVSQATETTTFSVGPTLRKLRTQRGLSLERLAQKSGVSRAMLSQIELGQSVPTINSVWKIAQALELPFAALLGEERSSTSRIVRVADLPALHSRDGSFSSRPLFPPGASRRVEFYELKLAAGAREDAAPHLTGTTENLVVVEGQVTIDLGETSHVLGRGDSIVFEADVPHVYRNTGTVQASLYLVMQYSR